MKKMNEQAVITAENINELRVALQGNSKCMEVLGKASTKKITKSVNDAFFGTEKLDAKIADAVNAMSGDVLEQTAIPRLSYKLPRYAYLGKFNDFSIEKGYTVLAKTIIDGLCVLGHLVKREEIVREIDKSGRSVYRRKHYVDFGEEKTKDLTRGMFAEPGKLINKFVHVKPGGKAMKLTGRQKDFFKGLSSMKLRLVKLPAERLREYFLQTNWYVNALEKGLEDKILLNNRINKYIAIIEEYQQREGIFLTNWFDSRLRLYYDLTMAGINPHGDSFETHMWELAEPTKINKDGFENLRHSIVVIATDKRHTEKNTEKLWSNHREEYLNTIVDADHYKHHKDSVEGKNAIVYKKGDWKKGGYGEHLYGQRLAQAIVDYESGEPSYFMMGEDATTGGLQHAGIGFRSVKSMKLSNVGGLKTPQDAHGELASTFDLPRQTAKDINTPLLHGSTIKTISTILTAKTGHVVSEETIQKHISSTYGAEIQNVTNIASWGSQAYDNFNSSLLYTAIDGMKCQSIGYCKSVEMKIYALSLDSKSGYSQTIVYRDMPLFLDKKGGAVYDDTKVRGLHANVTHSIDGWVVRQVIESLANLGKVGMFKHDKFYTHPNDMRIVRKRYKSSLLVAFDDKPYHRALEEVSLNRKGRTIPVLPLITGDGTKDMILESEGYLSA